MLPMLLRGDADPGRIGSDEPCVSKAAQAALPAAIQIGGSKLVETMVAAGADNAQPCGGITADSTTCSGAAEPGNYALLLSKVLTLTHLHVTGME